jgi:hypothetical protein
MQRNFGVRVSFQDIPSSGEPVAQSVEHRPFNQKKAFSSRLTNLQVIDS